jgi:hypothetical protein
MDAPKKRRCRFGLKTLFGVVGLVALALYFRPNQLHPRDVPAGVSKAWVRWYCGEPVKDGVAYFDYCPPPYDRWICVLFVEGDYDRVEKVVLIRKMPYKPGS